MKILILGCGYVGSALAQAIPGQNEIWGVTLSTESHEHLKAIGVHPIAADVAEKNWTHRLPGACDILINTLSSRGGDYRSTYWKSNHDLIQKYQDYPPKICIFTSSTSVYSQTDASIVTEKDPAIPSSPMRNVLLKTEKLLLNESPFPCVTVLRLGGIYGPGRHALLDDLHLGTRTFAEDPHRWINSIHRDDAVSAILHVMNHPAPKEIFNAVDNEPIQYGDCLLWLAQQLQIDPPIFDPKTLPARQRQGPKPNRRISNAKLRSIGWSPKYPTFREGFKQIFEEESK